MKANKKIVIGKESREKMLEGMSLVSDAVKVTMGPKGRNVVIQTHGLPKVTNDGVSVAREIFSKDNEISLGIDFIKKAAENTNREAGDGTTTTVVLTEEIVKQGLKYIEKGVNQFELSKKLHLVKDRIISELLSQKQDVKTLEKITQVASISAQDSEMGELIAKTMHKIGVDGAIDIEESQTMELSTEIKDGMSIGSGYVSSYLVTNQDKQECMIEKPLVLVTDSEISTNDQLRELFNTINNLKYKNIVIFAKSFDGDAAVTLITNKVKGVLNLNLVALPGSNDNEKTEYAKDICAVTGATLISNSLGTGFDKVNETVLGEAKKVVSKQYDTTIVTEKKIKGNLIVDRIVEIKAKLKEANTNYEKDILKKRIASLSNGVAIIKVGASTEIEMRNKKDKIEDAVNATRAAMQEGYVVGGGLALAKIGLSILDKYDMIAANILCNAVLKPYIQIIKNGYNKKDKKIIKHLKNQKNNNIGFDAKTGYTLDLLDDGIIDAVKVLRVSLENAVSSACMVLTTEGMITSIDETK